MKTFDNKKTIKRIFASILATTMIFAFVGCAAKEDAVVSQDERINGEAFALDTIVNFSVWGGSQAIIDGAIKVVHDYENMFSKSIEGSDVYNMNNAGGAPTVVSDETIEILQIAIDFGDATGGMFDITILPVKDLWDFKTSNPYLPSKESMDEALKKVDYHNIVIDGNTVTLLNGAEIDLGSIAKGYIGDKVKEYLESQGIKKAIINLGGNVLMVGEKEKDLPWTVGVQHPDAARNESFATVQIVDYSVVTSGIYERFFELDGEIYHHIINPYTGYPINNGILSVTILSDLSVIGDTLSTSLFALGVEDGTALIENMDNVEAIFILEDYTVVKTSGVDDYGYNQLG